MSPHKLPVLFLATAAACLVAGVCLGLAMGVLHDFRLAPVHAHVNLVGWTSLSVMGLVYRTYAELLARRVLAWVQFALSAGAALVFPVGIYLAITQDQPALAIGAGLAWLAGAVLFLAQLVLLALRRDTPAAMATRPATGTMLAAG